MGVDINQFPAHVQKQIRDKKANGSGSALHAKDIMKVKARPREDRLNKTERNYAGYLQKKLMAGEIYDWKHEPFNLRLADRTFYKPDFVVVTLEGFIQIDEVKGRWMDDALVKIKVAAREFPWFTFRACFLEKGVWKFRKFNTAKDVFQMEEV